MGEFRTHRVRFFEYTPQAINCLAYDASSNRLAASREDGTIEIYSIQDDWYLEKVIPSYPDQSVEALVWYKSRLFSAGLHGDVHEYDLLTLRIKHTISSNGGAIWCLTVNPRQTHIAAGTEDGCIVLFEILDSGPQYDRQMDRQAGRILCLAWYEGPEGENVIVSGGVDNIRIWSVGSGHATQRLTLPKQQQNRETTVWCVAVTKDFTIVSGDSRGRTCLWNGRQGTLLKSIHTHEAAVLSICLNEEGTQIFSSGADPTVVQCEYVAPQPNSDWKMWVKSSIFKFHVNDVRALACTGNGIVSGGKDCQLVLKLDDRKGGKIRRNIPPVPQSSLVHSIACLPGVMLQYPDSLEIWKLGSTKKTSETNGDILPLSSNPTKLIQLKAKGGEPITCSSISNDCEWIAYSTLDSLRIFQVACKKKSISASKLNKSEKSDDSSGGESSAGEDGDCDSEGDIDMPVKLTIDMDSKEDIYVAGLSKVRLVPAEVLPVRCMIFTPDGSRLLLSATDGSVQVLQLDALTPTVAHTWPPQNTEGVHLLAVGADNKHLVTADHDNNVHVYDLTNFTHVCTLPRYKVQPCAIAVHPKQPIVLVAYCDQRVIEYNWVEQEYTKWSRKFERNLHPQWMMRNGKVKNIFYNIHNYQQIFLADEESLCVIDTSQPFPEKGQALYGRGSQGKNKPQSAPVKHAIHISNRYKYLLHLDVLKDDFLVVVERTPLAIMDTIGTAIVRKRFGT